MRLVKIATSMAMVLTLTAPLDAASNGPKGPTASSSKAPKLAKTTTAPKGPKATSPTATKAPKLTTAKTTTPKTKAPKTTAKVDAKLAKAETKSAKKTGTAATSTTATSSTGTETTTTATTTTPTAVDFTQGPVAEKLARNTNLRTKLEARLQAVGYDGTVYQAAYGFKNQGQFVAATNVARNTGASFEQLKLQMTGLSVDADGVVLKANLGPNDTITMVDAADVTNPAPTKSLGQALKTVKSSVDATAAAQTATSQADAEIAATSVTN